VFSPKLLIPVAAFAAVSLALAGCSASPTGPRAGSNTGADAALSVVATTTQVADFTRNVVGDTEGVTVTQLIQPNQSAHSYDPSAADLADLANADVLVINGVGLESWLDDAVTASGFDGVTIDSDEGIVISGEATTENGTGENGTEGAEHGEGGENTDHADHDHSGGNPHIWTDVHNAQVMVATIARGLETASAQHADAFAANAVAYSSKLGLLDTWIRENVNAVPAESRLLVSNHDALGYFTAAYGITYVGSVIPSFDDNAEPSAAQIDELVKAIRRTGVKAVFSEASVNAKAAKTIAKEADVTVYSGADALYVDSLGPAGSAGATYLSAQLHNVVAILESWGVTPTPVPAGLGE
jgi:ABC-type Zn uptake system ZnuABC Zn-binding protein ZnuA